MEEYTLHLSIELLPEGQFLATSTDLPSLVAQGRTVAETLDIARDVARKLIDSYVIMETNFPPDCVVSSARSRLMSQSVCDGQTGGIQQLMPARRFPTIQVTCPKVHFVPF